MSRIWSQKYVVISFKASLIFVSVSTTVSKPHSISRPEYTTHSESKYSEQGTGLGQPWGVGHGAGVISPVSEHPHFLHPQVVQVLVAIV